MNSHKALVCTDCRVWIPWKPLLPEDLGHYSDFGSSGNSPAAWPSKDPKSQNSITRPIWNHLNTCHSATNPGAGRFGRDQFRQFCLTYWPAILQPPAAEFQHAPCPGVPYVWGYACPNCNHVWATQHSHRRSDCITARTTNASLRSGLRGIDATLRTMTSQDFVRCYVYHIVSRGFDSRDSYARLGDPLQILPSLSSQLPRATISPTNPTSCSPPQARSCQPRTAAWARTTGYLDILTGLEQIPQHHKWALAITALPRKLPLQWQMSRPLDPMSCLRDASEEYLMQAYAITPDLLLLRQIYYGARLVEIYFTLLLALTILLSANREKSSIGSFSRFRAQP